MILPSLRSCSRVLSVMTLACVLAASAVMGVGCSTAKQFASTSTPMATIFATDLAKPEAVALPNGAAANTKAASMLTACQAGDKATVAPLWYGVSGDPGVRDSYLTMLNTLPRYQTADGGTVKGIKSNNVLLFDYVLSIGAPPTTPPAPAK